MNLYSDYLQPVRKLCCICVVWVCDTWCVMLKETHRDPADVDKLQKGASGKQIAWKENILCGHYNSNIHIYYNSCKCHVIIVFMDWLGIGTEGKTGGVIWQWSTKNCRGLVQCGKSNPELGGTGNPAGGNVVYVYHEGKSVPDALPDPPHTRGRGLSLKIPLYPVLIANGLFFSPKHIIQL